jgi:hypothetical protein
MNNKISKVQWNRLTFRQKETRLRALEALGLMRKRGSSLYFAARQTGTTAKTIRKHIGKAVYKRKGKWKAKSHDRISRVMTIFSSGKRFNIETGDSETASIIGRYSSVVGHFSQTGDTTGLEKMKGLVVKDSSGKSYVLESRPSKVIGILQRLEEPDVPTIYAIEA